MTIPIRPVPPPRDGAPPAFRTEATRLLSAGVYFDTGFRSQVIEELVEHEERPVPPSLGIDALPVLAHALRARRQEAQTGAWLLLIWAAFIGVWLAGTGSETMLPIPWFAAYAALCAVAWVRRSASGVGLAVFTLDRAMIKEATRGRLKLLLPVVTPLVGVLYVLSVATALLTGRDAWAGAFFPFLLAVPVWAYRGHVTAVMCHELGRAAYSRAPRAALADSAQWRRIGAAIDREQHSQLTIYDPFRPFIGAGEPYEPWSLAMELKPAKVPDGAPPARPQLLAAREVIELIKPRMTALRDSAADSRDRLRTLEIDEFVYLPAGLNRAEVVYAADAVGQHLKDAAGEGGEARRHFLRIRIGAWDEQIVVTVLVRVHTQGGMLVLEVVPHVLTPVRPEFRAVDVIEARGQADPVRHALRGLMASPGAGLAAGACLLRTGVTVFRTWLADPQHALPDGPTASVRELGSAREVSLFQEMDISRYVKTVQDRIASGVLDALRSKGYATGEFEQQIVNVSGGVYIGVMSGGAVAAGERASAKHTEGGA
ncbi:hypothetical protein [Streptomyces sp. NBC_01477]|uniref:hypothetical protein n=1 Tax=Streptomyces sp. NBC_01477 TaxID=2976015 RepID=UPI002E3761F1|nr:hypothetical protein [Streptomyces sp. NBC_01477]